MTRVTTEIPTRQTRASPAPSANPFTGRTQRLEVIDLGRGAVMALMALDHTRTFLTNVTYNPTDLTRTFPALFFTRWTSHFCTPFFLFLAGSGVYFAATRRSSSDTARWLVTRGVVLVALEMTAVRWGWYFNVDYRHTSLQILWAIGVSMMLLATLVPLPSRLVGAIGVAVVAFHNLVGPWVSGATNNWVWSLLYERGAALSIAPGVVVAVNFPVLPLFGVMAMGYGFGEVFRLPPRPRRDACVAAGAVAIVAFVALRVANLYGDPLQWVPHADSMRSVMSFFLLTKHPLSLLMTLATLGMGLIWLGLVQADRPWWRPVITIGRVPMFFYLVHVPLIHAIVFVLAWMMVGEQQWLLTSPFDRGATRVPDGWGFGLPGVYAWTALILVVLYPLCRRLADLKARSRSWWVSYL